VVGLKHRLDDALNRQRVTEIGQGVGLAGQHGAQLLELATIGRGTRIGWQARHRSTLRRRSVDELETLFNSIQKRDVSTLKPRERIMTNFSAELRKKEILAYLLKLETKTVN
jgi:hypothetical protein